MLLQLRLRSTLPFLLTLCLLISLGSVGILGTTPAFAQGRNKQNSEATTTRREDGDFQLRLGQQAEKQGQLDKAVFHWLKAANIYQRFGDEESLGLTYDYLGESYVALGEPLEAENAFRRRLAVARDRDDLQAQMFALNNLGTLFLQEGNLLMAEEVFTDALAIARSVENALTAGLSLSNLGLAATLRGEYGEAIKRYQTALLFHREAKNPAAETLTLTNLGDAFLYAGQGESAIIAYTDALLAAEDIRDFENKFRALEGRYLTRKTMNQTDLAFKELNRWAKFAREQNNLNEEFKTVENAAFLYAELGDLEQAEIFLIRAAEMAEQLGALDRLAFYQQKLSEVKFGQR
ncbi:Tetratricopeptide TPR_1 repeat-containing protein [[Leptolyngbya] sp. PCC 7376]|uniref:tetratricopeptide repeat protein n=1 Tax=[Leptolyngbya] sp. PCC 7376 TaxID=111781 RepID=UPI00029EE47D|nr:tetratricopeptide repeat protein [[Leptolyngbya] sp. PCC 7376]AFY38987.1 Tetratricopeptide TPR_1 repeat-containing protein [[Leptolyngbya] sp. PCC 7376]